MQQVEIIERGVRVLEHRGEACWSRRCRKAEYAPLPAAVQKGGLAGPRLTAAVGYLKRVFHASLSTIRMYFRVVLNISLSRGSSELPANGLVKFAARPGARLRGQRFRIGRGFVEPANRSRTEKLA